jgi:hypothetical protein
LGHQFSFYYEISGSPRGGIVIDIPKDCSALAEDDRLTILTECDAGYLSKAFAPISRRKGPVARIPNIQIGERRQFG